MVDWTQVKGVVTKGHGVASGQAGDPRYPYGTLAMQKPVFAERGIFLEQYYLGTINISIHPYEYSIKQSKYTLRNVKWTSGELTEDFSFFDCNLLLKDGTKLDGLIYYPHPETKPEHFQAPEVFEVITHYIDALKYGDPLILEVDSAQIEIN
ncbi:MAG: hypothetical protein IGS48_23705 [Oscillatoriales cyanobacterium C42_A2020_001]|nr:hypothetical protein [Leptolyngbyaceae cyanobacterium C42_A2020_001]